MVAVFINASLLKEITQTNRFFVEGETVCQVLENIEKDYPGFKDKLLTKEREFQTYLMVYGYYKDELQARIVSKTEDNRVGLEKLKILTIACGG